MIPHSLTDFLSLDEIKAKIDDHFKKPRIMYVSEAPIASVRRAVSLMDAEWRRHRLCLQYMQSIGPDELVFLETLVHRYNETVRFYNDLWRFHSNKPEYYEAMLVLVPWVDVETFVFYDKLSRVLNFNDPLRQSAFILRTLHHYISQTEWVTA